MRVLTLVLLVAMAFAFGLAEDTQGKVAIPISIIQRPEVVSILSLASYNVYSHACSGTIISSRSVLTAANCVLWPEINFAFRIRAGSSLWNYGGSIYTIIQMRYPNFDAATMENDLTVVITREEIAFNNGAQPATFAGVNYVVPDSSHLQSVGWDFLTFPQTAPGVIPTVLRQQQLVSVNQDDCRDIYQDYGFQVLPTMICSGLSENGSVSDNDFKCYGEVGSPLFHNSVVVGVRSFDVDCRDPTVPTVNTRVSHFSWMF